MDRFLGRRSGWQTHDALYVKATDPYGREINKWTWMINTPKRVRQDIVTKTDQQARGLETNKQIVLRGGPSRVVINKSTGYISSVKHNGKRISLTDGPRFLGVGDSSQISSIKSYADGKEYVVEIKYTDYEKSLRYTINGEGWLEIDYHYAPPKGVYSYIGITFDYPSSKILESKWLGKGPYRVWKNRMNGVNYNVWGNQKNDTKTGQEWNYPEFKGIFSSLYWAQLTTTEQPITIISDTQNLFFRLLTPSYGINPRNTEVDFPRGDISFLNAIPPMGTKFNSPEELGPQGQPVKIGSVIQQRSGTIYFYFGEL